MGFCSNVHDQVARVYGSGGSFTGFNVTVHDVEVLGQDPTLGVFSVEVGFALDGGDELDAAGMDVGGFAEDAGTVILDVIPSVHGWVLTGGNAQGGAQQ